MDTLTQPPDNPPGPYWWVLFAEVEAARRGLPPAWGDPLRLNGPKVTPLFTRLLEAEAAARGLPPEPWAA
jgi:hypothetical protein